MDERDPLESLRDLEKGLDRARRKRDGGSTTRPGGLMQGNQNAMALGLRIGIELVVAVVVGAGLGWAIDRWLGTQPWGMIVLFFLGIGGGHAERLPRRHRPWAWRWAIAAAGQRRRRSWRLDDEDED